VKALKREASRALLRIRALLGADRPYLCSACKGHVEGFFRYGDEPHWGCPQCGASPRERFVNTALDLGLLRLQEGVRILHIAPSEKSLVTRFRTNGVLVGGDLHPARYRDVGAIRVDLVEEGPAGQFDIVYASHVLEHIPDDARALRNIHNMLRPRGELWALVPIEGASTRDGSPTMSPSEREREFGLWDHVRQYGMDFVGRLSTAGFEVHVIDAAALDRDIRHTHGIAVRDMVFVGVKYQE
jgi:SAM-dependent methyltransferase